MDPVKGYAQAFPARPKVGQIVAVSLALSTLLCGCAVSSLTGYRRVDGKAEIVAGERFGITIGASQAQVHDTMISKGYRLEIRANCTPGNDQCKGETNFARYRIISGLRRGTVAIYFLNDQAKRITWAHSTDQF